jgi:probable phosphoglycerate mutase
VEIVLVRHGQPAWTRDGMGVTNPPLTDLGLAQAERTAERLATVDIDAIVVSPLLRAQQTVAPLAAATGIAPVTEEWLAEIGNPDAWDTTPAEDIERVFAEARGRHVDEHWEGLPGGESFRAFHDRVTSGLRRWMVAEGATPAHPFPPLWNLPAPDRRIVVVAHAGTNAVILTELLGMKPVPWEWERFVTFHASITELRPMPISGAHSFSLFRLSDIAHFDPGLQTY